MELEIIKAIQSIASPTMDNIFEAITFLGEQVVYVALLTLIYWNVNKRLGKYLGFTLFLSLSINNLIKNIFKFKRPIGEPGIRSLRIETATGYSFPSGHSQGAATFFTSLAIGIKRQWVSVLAGILIFLIGLSRLYLGVHYPKDVIIGIFLGLIISYVSYRMFEKGFDKKRVYPILALIFLLSLIFSNSPDYIKACASFIGFMVGDLFEEKYVNFSVEVSLKQKFFRWVVGLILIIFIMTVGKVILPVSLISDFIRYFTITFVGLGLYPMIFKKINF